MKLEQLFEAVNVDVKKGQKVEVTKDSPEFIDVPTVGGESRYHYSFKKGMVFRIYSIGNVWIQVVPITEGTGVYKWAKGDKVTNFDIKKYKWRIGTSKFDGSWYKPVEDNLPADHIFTDLEGAKDWVSANGYGAREMTDNGDGTFNAENVKLTMKNDDKMIRVKFKNAKYFEIERPVTNLDMLPDECELFYINLGKDQHVKDVKFPKGIKMLKITNGSSYKISDLPVMPDVTGLTIVSKSLTSIEGIHKKFPNVKGPSFYKTDSIKGSLLELLNFEWFSFYEHKKETDLDKAIEILNKHSRDDNNNRKSRIIAAQAELIDNDLDDFA